MFMSIKLKNLVKDESIKNLNNLLSKEVKGSIAFDLISNIKEIKIHVENYNIIRNSLFKKYGEEKENNSSAIKPENIEQFKKEMEELLDKDIDVNIKKIKKEVLNNIQIKPIELMGLEWLFED